MLEKYSDILDSKDLIKILSLHKNTIYKLLQKKEIPNKKIGKKYMISKQDLIKYITSNRE